MSSSSGTVSPSIISLSSSMASSPTSQTEFQFLDVELPVFDDDVVHIGLNGEEQTAKLEAKKQSLGHSKQQVMRRRQKIFSVLKNPEEAIVSSLNSVPSVNSAKAVVPDKSISLPSTSNPSSTVSASAEGVLRNTQTFHPAKLVHRYSEHNSEPQKYSPGRTMSRRDRRLDNTCSLLDAGQIEGIDMKFLEPPYPSHFQCLLEDEVMLQRWLDFMNQPEDIQRKKMMLPKKRDPSIKKQAQNTKSTDPKVCFNRIDRRIRDMFHSSNIPFGTLQRLENELLESFAASSSFVLIWTLENSFSRIIAHGLCQYYQLTSFSDTVDGTRKTFIENPFSTFVAPKMTMLKFLKLER